MEMKRDFWMTCWNDLVELWIHSLNFYVSNMSLKTRIRLWPDKLLMRIHVSERGQCSGNLEGTGPTAQWLAPHTGTQTLRVSHLLVCLAWNANYPDSDKAPFIPVCAFLMGNWWKVALATGVSAVRWETDAAGLTYNVILPGALFRSAGHFHQSESH